MYGTDFDFKNFKCLCSFISHDLFTRIPITVVVEIQEAEYFAPPPKKKTTTTTTLQKSFMVTCHNWLFTLWQDKEFSLKYVFVNNSHDF